MNFRATVTQSPRARHAATEYASWHVVAINWRGACWSLDNVRSMRVSSSADTSTSRHRSLWCGHFNKGEIDERTHQRRRAPSNEAVANEVCRGCLIDDGALNGHPGLERDAVIR
jgi:hypothetical protein